MTAYLKKKLYIVLERKSGKRSIHSLSRKLSKTLIVILCKIYLIRSNYLLVKLDRMATTSDTKDDNPPQKRAKYVDKSPNKCNFVNLPREVILEIFKYLDVQSRNNCAMLCSTLNNISKDSSLYGNVTLKYNMNMDFLESLITKILYPKEVRIEYKVYNQNSENEDYKQFDKHVEFLFKKCGEFILSLEIDSCQNEDLLLNLGKCINLKSLNLYRCKSSFKTLPSLTKLKKINFLSCHFPQKIVSEMVKVNEKLEYLSLSDNININSNEICEIMSKHNLNVKEIHFSERKRVKSKSLKTLGRLTKLRKLELISGPGFDSDPEDVLEQLAAGCPFFETLVIYGWKEINDDNLIPALHMFSQLKNLDLRGTNITIKSCREAALTLPVLKVMDVIKNYRIKKAQLVQLQKDFKEIHISTS